MDFENGQLRQVMAQQQAALRVCFLDIEKVMTYADMTSDVSGTIYSAEAVRCITALCSNPINMKLIFISRAILSRSPNMFYFLERCNVQDKWLYHDWTLNGVSTISKREAVLAGLRRLPKDTQACVIDDEPTHVANVPVPVFVPADGAGLTYNVARDVAEYFNASEAFDGVYKTIPVRSELAKKTRHQLSPDRLV